MHFPTLFLLLQVLLCQIATIRSATYDADGWEAGSKFLLEAIDTSVNPCKNFYQFACGKWQKTYKGQYIGEPQKTIKAVAEQLLQSIERIRENDSTTPRYQKQLKTFYSQCVAATTDYELALINIYNHTAKLIGPMPLMDPARVRRKDPYFLIGQMQRLLNTKVLMDTMVLSSQDKCMSTPHLTLLPPFRHKLRLKLNSTSFTDKLLALGAATGARLNADYVSKRISDLVEFEENATKIFGSMETSESVTYRLSELRREVNNKTHWRAFFAGLFPEKMLSQWRNQNPEITFFNIEYFRRLDELVDKLGFVDLLDYGYLRLFDSYMTHYMVTPTLLQSNVTALTTEQQCLEYVLKYASAAAARVFFESIGSKPDPKRIWNWKHDLELVAEAVFAAHRYMIHTAEWLDVDDKAAIVGKVNAIRFVSGIPQWILNDSAVLKHTPPFDARLSIFENDLRMYRKKFEWQLEPLLTGQALPMSFKITGEEVYMDPDPTFNWNAYYFEKSVELWMGLTLPPMYNYSYPLALKFGLIGWIVGHELFHGFDSNNINERIDGKHWLKPQTIKEFAKRAHCIVRQYSGFCYPEDNFCVSGTRTLNDNIADMDGIKIAYMAYKFVTQSVGRERPLPGLERFTPDQLFFLSAARVWCGTGEDVEIYKGGDEHSPSRARVELSMMNFPAFAQAFRCPTGSKFAPMHTCTLWGDFLEPNMDEMKKKR